MRVGLGWAGTFFRGLGWAGPENFFVGWAGLGRKKFSWVGLGWAEKNWTGRFGPKYIFGALNIPMPILIVIYALIYGYFTENKKKY